MPTCTRPSRWACSSCCSAAARSCGSGATLPELPAALPVDVIDLEGRRLIPGLIDGHVHVTGGGGEAGFSTRVPAPMLSRYTRAGVTSVVGLLGTDDVARSTRELVASIHALREQGLNAWGYSGGYHLPPTTLTGSVRGDIVFVDAADRRRRSRDQRPPLQPADPRRTAAARVGSARRRPDDRQGRHRPPAPGRRCRVAWTWCGARSTQSELPARVFNPTHVNRRKALFEEAVELARRGCCIDITAFPVEEGEDAWSAADALLRYLRQRRAGRTRDHQLRCRRLPAVFRRAMAGSAAWTSASPARCWPR